jgi:NADPH-dependent curcumin reductase CurA
MPGGAVSEVISSALKSFNKGDFVVGYTGWQEYAFSDGNDLRKIDPTIAPISTALGVLGMPGMTAYVGLSEIGKPKPGETLVVAAASGAVGSVTGQIGKILGCHVVGIAGGPEKTRYLTDKLGFDAGVDHRARDFPERLKEACPRGIDVYFENVGGKVWDAVFPLLNRFARVPVCGLIAYYNATEMPKAAISVSHLQDAILVKRLTLRGFIVDDFADRTDEFLKKATPWVAGGRIKYREDVVNGLEMAPRAFIGLLRGENFGKLVVRISN